jgi:hypothetical protein
MGFGFKSQQAHFGAPSNIDGALLFGVNKKTDRPELFRPIGFLSAVIVKAR